MSARKLVLMLIFSFFLVVGCQGQGAEETAVPTNTAAAETAEPTGEPEPAAAPTATITGKESDLTEIVDIKLFLYQPKAITVTVGTAVTWINHDDIQHSVTNGTPELTGEAFDSDFFFLDDSYTFTFSEPGTYQYYCKRHNHMKGTIEVVE